jgi:hypothetical protein
MTLHASANEILSHFWLNWTVEKDTTKTKRLVKTLHQILEKLKSYTSSSEMDEEGKAVSLKIIPFLAYVF